MSDTFKIEIKYNKLPELARKIPDVTEQVVRKAAFDIEAYAKTVVPVDTGKLKNSITSEFPAVHSAIIAPHTEYAAFVEFGTRRMRARPYMRPAAERVAPSFIAALSKLEELLE